MVEIKLDLMSVAVYRGLAVCAPPDGGRAPATHVVDGVGLIN